jgi:hypothetical protein
MLAQIETPPVSWLGGSLTVRCKNATNLEHQRGLPILDRITRTSNDSRPKTVACAEEIRLTVARRRRLCTVFPCAEFRVIVNDAAKLSPASLLETQQQ